MAVDQFLHELAAIGDAKQMEVLFRVDGVKDINAADDDVDGKTALHWSVRKGHKECCEILLENGADPSSRMTHGWTPAHCAAEIGDVELLKLLHTYSSDLFALDNSGDSPKKIAEIYGHTECVDYLLSLKQNMETTNNEDKSKEKM